MHARSGKANKPYRPDEYEHRQHIVHRKDKMEDSLVHNQATARDVDQRMPFDDFVKQMKEEDVEQSIYDKTVSDLNSQASEAHYANQPQKNPGKALYETLNCYPRSTPQHITERYYAEAYACLPRSSTRTKQQSHDDWIKSIAVRKAGKVLRNPEKKRRYDTYGDGDEDWLRLQQGMNPYLV